MENESRKSDELLTPAQVSEILGISKQRVSQLIKSGKLKVKIVDGRHLIHPNDMEAVKDRKIGRPRKDEEADTHSEVWEITIEAVVKLKRKKSNEIKDESDPNDNDE